MNKKITIIIAVVAQQQRGAYTQDTEVQTYFEINEPKQELISKVIGKLQNLKPESMVLWDDGTLIVRWTENITATAPDGRTFDITNDISLWANHKYTAPNGYTFRDDTIYASNGTELFK